MAKRTICEKPLKKVSEDVTLSVIGDEQLGKVRKIKMTPKSSRSPRSQR